MPIHPFEGAWPSIADDAFIAPGAQVIGRVTIGRGASVWYNCVLRGDVEPIVVGEGTNIQDGTIVHVTTGRFATTIGAHCLIGHQAIIHGCTLQDHSFVGFGAAVMDGCVVETDAMVAAGALLTPGKRVESGQLWAGSPAKFVRMLGEEELRRNREAPAAYARLAKRHIDSIEPDRACG
ncbi:gamma carbonic anhydrase family protein [Sphingobium sp. 22B]|uniref:gamma carbonic anhydrase family protein n=1 Tax=unclassified Sphingobium TaxID=2611147 RepID=UPI0007810A2F|nr:MULTISPECIES: gamma carbonic anhydrase family protein [unclassified Sphingobium]KXU30489.1 gamma carbonic anhydrase family protein [Sphingobium sp. AM]KYC30748.1 gamma carbonic anhydrase family protein [Sphingobium sp. 22B]OAP30047.1 gamma carbonic anhydrase family protein [Sphingobium sp. 20006FA]